MADISSIDLKKNSYTVEPTTDMWVNVSSQASTLTSVWQPTNHKIFYIFFAFGDLVFLGSVDPFWSKLYIPVLINYIDFLIIFSSVRNIFFVL